MATDELATGAERPSGGARCATRCDDVIDHGKTLTEQGKTLAGMQVVLGELADKNDATGKKLDEVLRALSGTPGGPLGIQGQLAVLLDERLRREKRHDRVTGAFFGIVVGFTTAMLVRYWTPFIPTQARAAETVVVPASSSVR